jgi:hypothetical protein
MTRTEFVVAVSRKVESALTEKFGVPVTVVWTMFGDRFRFTALTAMGKRTESLGSATVPPDLSVKDAVNGVVGPILKRHNEEWAKNDADRP